MEAERKKVSGTRQGKQWDEASVLQDLGTQRGSDAVATAQKILEWAKGHAFQLRFGTGTTRGQVILVLEHKGQAYHSVSVVSSGFVEISLGYMKRTPPFDDDSKRREFVRRLNEIPGANLAGDKFDKFPSIRLDILKEETALKQLLQALEWFVHEVSES